MSDNGTLQPAAEPLPTHQVDKVNLRITYLHAGNPRPPHELGAIPADTSIADLRLRLRDVLPEHPEPIEQRLIYQGRPLMNSNATIREALRLDGPIGPLPFTLHIILQTRGSQDIPRSHAQSAVADAIPQPTTNATAALHQTGQLPNNLSQEQTMHALGQASLHIQRQLLGGIPINNPPFPHPPQINPPHFTQSHLEQHRLQHEAMVAAHQAGLFPFPQPGIQRSNLPQSRHISVEHGPDGVRYSQSFIGHDGNQVTRTWTGGVNESGTPLDPTVPVARAASAPPPPDLQHLDLTPTSQPEPTRTIPILPPPIRPNSAAPISRHLPYPFPTPQIHAPITAQPPSRTSLWLTQSANGPEAILFAPGHGYFSSPQAAQAAASAASSVLIGQGEHPRVTVTPNTAPQAVVLQNEMANIAAAPALRQAPAGQLVARRQNRNQEDNDIFAWVIQRAWLFLRLYMFTFVLSEPGTWRRWFLLSVAIFVSLLPRQNPATQLFALARRHIENLIGPPLPRPGEQQRPPAAAEPQQPGQTQQQPNTTQPTASSPNRGAVATTPEEAAARLLRQHQQRNPSLLRDTLYRIEQSVALFLASLIPGVGERYVRAREVSREAERRREEEAQNATAPVQTQDQPVRSTDNPQQIQSESSNVPSPDLQAESRSQEGKGVRRASLDPNEAEIASATGVDTQGESDSGRVRFRVVEDQAGEAPPRQSEE